MTNEDLADIIRAAIGSDPPDINCLPVFREWQGAEDLFNRANVLIETGGMTDAGWLATHYEEALAEQEHFEFLRPEVIVHFVSEMTVRAADSTVRYIFNEKPRGRVRLVVRLGFWMKQSVRASPRGTHYFMDTMYRFQEQ